MAELRDIFDGAVHYGERLLTAAPVKVAAAGSVSALATVGHWAMTPGLIQAALIVLAADWLTGTWKAWALHRVNSRAGVRGAVKSFIYLSILAYCMHLSASSPLFGWLDEFFSVVLILTEFSSVLENLVELDKRYGWNLRLLRILLKATRLEIERRVAAMTAPLTPNPLQDGDPHEQGRSDQAQP